MALAVQYSQEVRRQVMSYPVWEPGEEVRPGDVGELTDGVFHRTGSVRDIFDDLDLSTAERESDEVIVRSAGVRKRAAGAAGSVTAAGLPLGAAAASVEFSSSGAVLLHATGCSRQSLTKIGALRRTIEDRVSDWPRGTALVSHVETAERYAVAIAGGRDAALSIEGSLEPLNALKIADASISVSGDRDIAYQRKGAGPILLRIYGFGFWGRLGGTKLLSRDTTPDDRMSFGEFSARNHLDSLETTDGG